jgi:hypothetical protein
VDGNIVLPLDADFDFVESASFGQCNGAVLDVPDIGTDAGPGGLRCNVNEISVDIELLTDNFGIETGLSIVDSNGISFLQVNPFDFLESNTAYDAFLCLPFNRCYTFTITDTYVTPMKVQ